MRSGVGSRGVGSLWSEHGACKTLLPTANHIRPPEHEPYPPKDYWEEESRPDPGLGFQVEVLEGFQGVPSSLGSGARKRARTAHSLPERGTRDQRSVACPRSGARDKRRALCAPDSLIAGFTYSIGRRRALDLRQRCGPRSPAGGPMTNCQVMKTDRMR